MPRKDHMKTASGFVILAAISTAGCAPFDGARDNQTGVRIPPAFIQGPVSANFYDGTTNDLLTAGLGKSELRRNAIYGNYRALVDMTPAGGYGVLYGPNIDLEGNDRLGEGKTPGTEFVAYADDGTGKQNVTMMVQVPKSFDPANPCIVTATSSGSRGVYGAIATSGEWGLKRGCAGAYTDKGTGSGVHDLQNHTVNLITGVRAEAKGAGATSNFTANLSDAARDEY